VTLHCDIYGAGRTATGVAEDLARFVGAVGVLLLVAVFAA